MCNCDRFGYKSTNSVHFTLVDGNFPNLGVGNADPRLWGAGAVTMARGQSLNSEAKNLSEIV